MLDVFLGRPMSLGIQRHQNLGVRCANGAAGAVCVVDGAIRHSDVIQNRDQLLLGNLLAKNFLYFVAQARCLFQPEPGASADVEAEDTGVNRGEEILAEKERQSYRPHAKAQEASDEDPPMAQASREGLMVAVAQPREPAFKSL